MPTESDRTIYRILDAAANRAGEGMRTLEEFARFVLDDGEQSQGWKDLRHDLAAVLEKLPRRHLLMARDTAADVGTQISHERESRRPNVATVLAAASTRTQQALRTLEEYGKTIDPQLAEPLEALRYRCYTLSAALELEVLQAEMPDKRRQEQLYRGQLYALIDCGESDEDFRGRIAALGQAGVDLFQLRDRAADDRTLFQRARLGSQTAHQQGCLFIVNDRADIAVAAGADGVHVGQDELPAIEARRILGAAKLVGVSTHSLDQARQAVADGADYLGFGPVFAGHTKQFETYVGTAPLREIADQISIPVFAIGGIDAGNVDQVTAAGIQRIAVSGAVRDADDPVAAVRGLKQSLAAALPMLLVWPVLLGWVLGGIGGAPRGWAEDPESAVDREAVLGTTELTESSGLAFSQRTALRVWTHNDSGGKPRLYAFDTAGRPTGRAELLTAAAKDWESLASFTDRGTARLLLADSGDRPPRRKSIDLYLLDEPNPDAITDVTDIQTIKVTYPGGPCDCEAVAVDVARRQIILIAKRLASKATVYTIPLPEPDSQPKTIESVASEVTHIGVMLVTGAEVDGTRGDLWVTSYARAFRFPSGGEAATLRQQLAQPPVASRLPPWRQIEAIAVDGQGNAWITHEGAAAKLGRLRPPPSRSDSGGP